MSRQLFRSTVVAWQRSGSGVSNSAGQRVAKAHM
ncbi:hypothetical protein RR46_07270 [Papilio xuthus]|uniref:Uncharacterized protein n=1 Tax=Papilio xuthus TaxID=66420 RepID=A0A194PWX8_PAPXU|nr:hypothetical protein RR46_07270 [Papilio xuthus]